MKDNQDDDPAIRGLALRSLCSLRAPTMTEYIESAVRRGLTDRSGYVRRTAAIGVLKLCNLNPAVVDGRHIDSTTETGVNKTSMISPNVDTDGLVEILFAMLNDVDTQVNTDFMMNRLSIMHRLIRSCILSLSGCFKCHFRIE